LAGINETKTHDRCLTKKNAWPPMPYFFIPLVGSVTLVSWYVFVTDVPLWSKILVAALLVLSLVLWFGHTPYGLAGVFLQVVLSVYVLLYLAYLRARF
jgi:hypothetical protein